jgi:hypothetical protein
MFDKSRIALQWNEPQMKIKLSGKLPEPYRDDQLVYYTIKTGRVEHQEKNALHSYILEKLKDNCDLKIGRNSNNRGKDENNHSHITKSNRAGRGCNPSTYQHLRPYQ